MSVTDLDVVDFAGQSKSTGELILTISDHLAWDGDSHLLSLQKKLNAYLRFIEGGDAKENFSQMEYEGIAIEIVCKYVPDEDAIEFLNVAAKLLKNAGIRLGHRVA